MSTEDKVKLEIIEKYSALGEKRYVVKITGTNILINIKAENEDEALKRARKLLFG
ncbi:hypothetical protein EYM_03245 [Ignicoccus islandicus DSM 13165]|uniref:Uncharacterized protein n=1 Tax=Ignicoccus islandicus DSM 13165 TaxID=940295 RepID=A0A0U2WL22_9CREN|nr:hypothetical protein [Ignicoccus islandicus]ALU11633.1 hypothetical protein EYM_03245 [Ignicoccus islandicus DSM 13165]